MGFSRPYRSLNLPNGTVRILAEPSNNSNLGAVRQLSGQILLIRINFAQLEMHTKTPRTAGAFGHARLFA